MGSAFIIRLPVRLIYDNNYFNDAYQGIPIGGYTQIVEKMLASDLIDVETLPNKQNAKSNSPRLSLLGWSINTLAWVPIRNLRFETEELDVDNYQGNTVVNYTDAEIPYTRVIEHKHFEFGKGDVNKTIVTKEYPVDWHRGDEPYYPVNNQANNSLYKKYAKLAADTKPNVIFGGRLGQYRYYDMDQVLHAALVTVEKEFN